MPFPVFIFIAVFLFIACCILWENEKHQVAFILPSLVIPVCIFWFVFAWPQKTEVLASVPIQRVTEGENKIPVAVFRGEIYSLQYKFNKPVTKECFVKMIKLDRYSKGIDWLNEKIYPELVTPTDPDYAKLKEELPKEKVE